MDRVYEISQSGVPNDTTLCPGSSVEEQKPSKLKVVGSIPPPGTIRIISSVG